MSATTNVNCMGFMTLSYSPNNLSSEGTFIEFKLQSSFAHHSEALYSMVVCHSEYDSAQKTLLKKVLEILND